MMWPKTFLAVLTTCCMLLVVGFSGLSYAGGSPYNSDPVDEHPWGGDNIGNDGGSNLPGSTTGGTTSDLLPSSLGSTYYIQSIPLSYISSYLSRFLGKDSSSSILTSKIEYLNRTSDKSSSTSEVDRGVGSK